MHVPNQIHYIKRGKWISNFLYLNLILLNFKEIDIKKIINEIKKIKLTHYFIIFLYLYALIVYNTIGVILI